MLSVKNLNYATFYLFYGSLSNIIITFFCVLFVCFNLFNSPLAEQITSPRGFQIMFLIVFKKMGTIANTSPILYENNQNKI